MATRPRIPIAWLILTADRSRLAISCARLTFAVVLMFSQLGFLDGSLGSTRRLFEQLDADLFLVSSARYNLFIDEEFPRCRLKQAEAVPGVVSASPLYYEDGASLWRNPEDRGVKPIRVLGFNLADPVFLSADVKAGLDRLKASDTALFDSRGRPHLGTPTPLTHCEHTQGWDCSELNRRRIRIVGWFQLGPDYRNDGNLLLSDVNFFRYFPRRQPERVAVGLLRLQPGADPAAVASASGWPCPKTWSASTGPRSWTVRCGTGTRKPPPASCLALVCWSASRSERSPVTRSSTWTSMTCCRSWLP